MENRIYEALKSEMFSLYPDLKVIFDERIENIFRKFTNILLNEKINKTDKFSAEELLILRKRFGVFDERVIPYDNIALWMHKRRHIILEIKNKALKKLDKLIYTYIHVKGCQKIMPSLLNISLTSSLFDFSPIILELLEIEGINTFGELIKLSTKEIYAIYNISDARGKEIIDYVHFLGYSFRDELIGSDLDATRYTFLDDLNLSSNLSKLLHSWKIYTVNDFMTKDINTFRLRKNVGIKTYEELKSLYIRCAAILRNERDKELNPSAVSYVPTRETILSKQFSTYTALEEQIRTLGKRRSKLVKRNTELDLEIEDTIQKLEATKIRRRRK